MRTATLSFLVSLCWVTTAEARKPLTWRPTKQRFEVVQKQLYDKQNLREVAIHAGVVPFDAFSVTPKIDVTYANYMSDTMAWELSVGAGYDSSNSNYKQLEGPAYGIEPDVSILDLSCR